MPAKLPEKGLSRRRGLYVSTVVPFRIIALVSKHEESSTTTNSVPGGKKGKSLGSACFFFIYILLFSKDCLKLTVKTFIMIIQNYLLF